jgi:Uma2 family endonuclease
MAIREKRQTFMVEEYHRMAEAGILHEDDRVELVEGEIIETSPVGSCHAACVKRLIKLLVREVGDSGVVGVQDPVLLPEDTEPVPGVTVLRPRKDFYAEAHPTPEDVLLLIEISETSLEYDREIKLPLYARAGIPEVWIVDLACGGILTYSRPESGSYEEASLARPGDRISPRVLPELVVSVGEILD